jgi:hypothetical protein
LGVSFTEGKMKKGIRNFLFVGILVGGVTLAGCDFNLPDQPTLPAPTQESTATVQPSPTAITSQPTETNPVVTNHCDNPYWPIIEGAYWVYDEREGFGGPAKRVTRTVRNIISNAEETTFELIADPPPPMVGGEPYKCTQEGIFEKNGNYILPSSRDFQEGAIYKAQGHQVHVSRIATMSVPAGTYDVVSLYYDSGKYRFIFSFSLGVGPVEGYFYDAWTEDLLVSYFIPK